jgi:hypothetical protein
MKGLLEATDIVKEKTSLKNGDKVEYIRLYDAQKINEVQSSADTIKSQEYLDIFAKNEKQGVQKKNI